MKKLISIFLSLLLTFCSFSFVAFGASISGNYTYTVTNKTYTTITKFNSKVSGDVVVPDKVGGYYVTHVGDGAFYWCYNITSITLPKRVTYIGDKAFEYCSKMKNISLPEGVTYIGDSAFEDCRANDWYTPYVIAAAEAGYVNGVSDTAFGANNEISRQDICTILGRILGLDAAEAEATFADVDDIADYALAAVKALADNGIIGGYEDGTFAPTKSATRAEVCKILSSVLSTITEEAPEVDADAE